MSNDIITPAERWLLLSENDTCICPLEAETEFPLRLKKMSLVALTLRRDNFHVDRRPIRVPGRQLGDRFERLAKSQSRQLGRSHCQSQNKCRRSRPPQT